MTRKLVRMFQTCQIVFELSQNVQNVQFKRIVVRTDLFLLSLFLFFLFLSFLFSCPCPKMVQNVPKCPIWTQRCPNGPVFQWALYGRKWLGRQSKCSKLVKKSSKLSHNVQKVQFRCIVVWTDLFLLSLLSFFLSFLFLSFLFSFLPFFFFLLSLCFNSAAS